jgi:hypothetical protein
MVPSKLGCFGNGLPLYVADADLRRKIPSLMQHDIQFVPVTSPSRVFFRLWEIAAGQFAGVGIHVIN